MPFFLPTLVMAVLLALLLGGCDSATPPPKARAEAVPNVYLEALQEAEAVRHTLEERKLEEQRIDALLGRTQSPAR